MDEDGDLSLLFNGEDMMEDPCRVAESLPPTYDKRFDMFRYEVQFVAMRVCGADRVDLVEKLLNGGYVGINEIYICWTTLLGVANSIKMAELLIKHGALFKGRGCNDFDCFSFYIYNCKHHMLNHFFNHPEFIYTDKYMYLAIANDNNPTIDILKRKRDIHHEDITMSTLFNNFYV